MSKYNIPVSVVISTRKIDDVFLKHVEKTFNPDLIIIGGGVSKKMNKFKDYITIKTPLKAAELKNNAGIIGAAIFAKKQLYSKS